MSINRQVVEYVLPTPASISRGSTDQTVNLTGMWNISSNCSSPRLKKHINALPSKISSLNSNHQLNINWTSANEEPIDEFHNRKNIGVFMPRNPLYILLTPDGLNIKPELIIKNIQWHMEWDIKNYCSTDEHHLLIGKFIQITSRTERGLFYGLQTAQSLLQITNNEIPLQTIHDFPKVSSRTILLNIQTDPINDVFFEDLIYKMASYKNNTMIIQAGKLT